MADPIEFSPEEKLIKFQKAKCSDCDFFDLNEFDVTLHRFKEHEYGLDRILIKMSLFNTLMPEDKTALPVLRLVRLPSL